MILKIQMQSLWIESGLVRCSFKEGTLIPECPVTNFLGDLCSNDTVIIDSVDLEMIKL